MVQHSQSQILLVLSMPRAGSSATAKTLLSLGANMFSWESEISQNPSEHNSHGYFEDSRLNLLNDNILRLAYGDFSFLNNSTHQLQVPKSRLSLFESAEDRQDFYYDLDEKSVETPLDYKENLMKYTGNSWDVWGLTRMTPGQKWYRAHSRTSTESRSSLQSSLSSLVSELTFAVENIDTSTKKNDPREVLVKAGLKSNRLEFNSLPLSHTLIVKDPRLIYTLPLIAKHLANLPIKLIFVERNKEANLASMRKHYGPRLFTPEVFSGTTWVSNHFNYKVKPQTFGEYTSIYLRFKGDCESLFPSLTIACEELSETSTHQRIISHAGATL